MPDTITATYKNGVFHPLAPIDLPDNKNVRIVILPEKHDDESADMVRMMTRAGLIRPSRSPSLPKPRDPVSDKKRAEIAKKLGTAKGKPLSEIILEERKQ